jgi:hypothetical protein
MLAYRPTSRAEIELHLRGYLETLHDALLAEPFGAEPARQIGAALVGIHLTKPEAIEVTLVVLADRLLADLGLDSYTFQPHLNRLLAAIAVGYTKALRDRVLSDQEQVYRAALAVHLSPPVSSVPSARTRPPRPEGGPVDRPSPPDPRPDPGPPDRGSPDPGPPDRGSPDPGPPDAVPPGPGPSAPRRPAPEVGTGPANGVPGEQPTGAGSGAGGEGRRDDGPG